MNVVARNSIAVAAFVVIVAAIVVVTHLPAKPRTPINPDAELTLPDGSHLTVFIVDTPTSRAQGLSDIPSMPTADGMLFLFPSADIYPFWMQRMHFPLDIIWLNNGNVVDVWSDAPAPVGTEPPAQYAPKAAGNEVLEINAGLAATHKITVGSTLDIQLPNGYTWPTNP